jgi:uncharacterized protein YbjT (DUF2867 family)
MSAAERAREAVPKGTTAFVLGATGFVGREVVRQLCVRGAKVIAHVRPDSKERPRWQQTFGDLGAAVDSTPWDVVQLGERFAQAEVKQVYILIGTTRAKAKADAVAGNIYEAVDYGLTKIAADAAKSSGAAPRLIYLSSVGADPKASSQYLAWRGKAEGAVIATGLDYVIARPSFITGARDESRPGEKIGSAVGDSLLAVAGLLGGRKLRAKYRSTSPDVLAAALIRHGEEPGHPKLVVDGAELR